MTYDVRVLAEVRELDMPALLAVDHALGRVVAGIVKELGSDPWLGTEIRERMRLTVLADCRKVPFDLPSWGDKPRFRLVYRNDPDDGSIAVVTGCRDRPAFRACRVPTGGDPDGRPAAPAALN